MDSLDTRLDMGDLVQQVFNEISLERDPSIWQSSRQDAAMTEKRINFLADFQETLFSKVCIKIYDSACLVFVLVIWNTCINGNPVSIKCIFQGV